MKKIIAEISMLLGSMLLFLTVLFTVVSIVNNNLVEKTFLSATITSEKDNELKTLATDSTSINEPSTIALTNGTQYQDWGDLRTIDGDYSSSTLLFGNNTKMSVNYKAKNGTVIYCDVNQLENQPQNGLPTHFPRVIAYPGDSFELTITNCGVDLNGENFDVIMTINNVEAYDEVVSSSGGLGLSNSYQYDSDLSKRIIWVPKDYNIDDFKKNTFASPSYSCDTSGNLNRNLNNVEIRPQAPFGAVYIDFKKIQFLNNQNEPKNGSCDYIEGNQNGDLINFSLNAQYSSCVVNMKYVRHEGNPTDIPKSNTNLRAAEINKVNGFFYDIDISNVGTYSKKNLLSQLFLEGNEGIVPNTGSSTIYWESPEKVVELHNPNPSEYTDGLNVDKKKIDNGICATFQHTETDGIWFKSAALMLTELANKGEYSFKYGGSHVTIHFSFVSASAIDGEHITKWIRPQNSDYQVLQNVVSESEQYDYIIRTIHT